MKDEITINGTVYVPKDSVQSLAPKKKGLEFCIVRTYSAGVWAGYIDRKKNSKENVVYEAVRLWAWYGASLSQVAKDGVTDSSKWKIPEDVSEVSLTEIIEVIPCTEKSQNEITNLKRWKQ